jgi:hypothetical protein
MKQSFSSSEQYFEQASEEIAEILKENTNNIEEKIARLTTYNSYILVISKIDLEYEITKNDIWKDFIFYGGLFIYTLLALNGELFLGIGGLIFVIIYLVYYWSKMIKLQRKILLVKKAIAQK